MRSAVLYAVVGAILLVPLVGTVVGRPGWWRHRAATVGAVVVAGLVVVALAAETSGTDRTSSSVGRTAPVAAGGRDLSTVSNEEMEAVVASNPTVAGMRLALVERYLRAGQLEKARLHAHAALEHGTGRPTSKGPSSTWAGARRCWASRRRACCSSSAAWL